MTEDLPTSQTSDRDSVSCPANWRPGDDVVLGAPTAQAVLGDRLTDHDLTLTDWCLATVPDRGTDR
jgi:peroxiredoxin 2/4